MTEEEVLKKLKEYKDFILSLKEENKILKEENSKLLEELATKNTKKTRRTTKKIKKAESETIEKIAEDENTKFEKKEIPVEDTKEKEINPQVIPEEQPNNKMIVKSAEKELNEMINGR